MDKTVDMLNTQTLSITAEILALISVTNEIMGAWRAFGTISPDRLAALRRVATIESVCPATRVEGSKLGDRGSGALDGGSSQSILRLTR